MADTPGTLELVARHLTLALRPLIDGVSDLPHFKQLMYRLGWSVADLPPAYQTLSAAVKTAVAKVDTLGDSPSADDIAELLRDAKQVYDAIQGIAAAPTGVDAAAFVAEVRDRLPELVLTDYLALELPALYHVLQMLNVIRVEHQAATANRPSFVRVSLDWSQIPAILGHPENLPAIVYGWGTGDLNVQRIVDHLAELLFAFGWPVNIQAADSALAAKYAGLDDDAGLNAATSLVVPFWFGKVVGQPMQLAVAVRELPGTAAALPGLVVEPQIPAQLPLAFPLTDTLALRVTAGTNAGSQVGILIRPDDVSIKYPFAPGTPPPQAGIGIGLDFKPATTAVLLGSASATRLDLKSASLDIGAQSTNGEFDVVLGAATDGLAFVLAAKDLDGFIGELLGRSDRTIPIALGIRWSNRTGFNFTGGAGLEVSTYPHLSLGPVRIERLDLAVKAGSGDSPNVTLKTGVALTAAIGPVAVAVDGIGVSIAFVFAGGNAGPFDVEAGFTPPDGGGIAVDAGAITGGGFLSFDRDKHRYAGALELSVYDVAVKAIGFVDTQLPNGQPGYSFLILISAEFTPIQLGLGFTLNGVGGLIAINRRLDVDAIWNGMLAGSVDDVLYAKDPVGDAPRIISELDVLFPQAPNHFVFAPTALIGWGTPTIVRAEVAIVFEPPSPLRVTLVGLISSTLPTEDLKIVELHVAVLGKIDFAQGRLAIDAKLYNSKIAGFTLTGDMAARLAWGLPPTIVVALGGLNPHFEPPDGFPTLDRLTLVLGSGDNPKLTCQAYFAITPNTLQFGVRAELYAAAAGFNLRGMVSFDCLVQQFPLSYRADLDGDVAFRRGDTVLASVHLEASMTGPVPYHVWGSASISLWLFSVSVPFDVTFGPNLPQPLPSVDPWPLLQAAIEDVRNWTGGSAPGLLDPGGAATFRQTVVPLNRTITRFGGGTPQGADRYTVTTVALNTTPAPDTAGVTEYFAAAQFDDLSDTEKLSRPSFERMDGGVAVGANTLAAGASVGAKVEYETIILDAPWQRRNGLRYTVAQDLQLLMLEQASSNRFGLDKFTVAAPPRVAFDEESFVVTSTADGTAASGFAAASTKGAALAALADHLKAHPEDRGQLQVVPASELATTP